MYNGNSLFNPQALNNMLQNPQQQTNQMEEIKNQITGALDSHTKAIEARFEAIENKQSQPQQLPVPQIPDWITFLYNNADKFMDGDQLMFFGKTYGPEFIPALMGGGLEAAKERAKFVLAHELMWFAQTENGQAAINSMLGIFRGEKEKALNRR